VSNGERVSRRDFGFLFLICEGNLTRAQGQKDAVEDRAFIYTRHACGVFRSSGLTEAHLSR
jgi:hypothetical protein